MQFDEGQGTMSRREVDDVHRADEITETYLHLLETYKRDHKDLYTIMQGSASTKTDGEVLLCLEILDFPLSRVYQDALHLTRFVWRLAMQYVTGVRKQVTNPDWLMRRFEHHRFDNAYMQELALAKEQAERNMQQARGVTDRNTVCHVLTCFQPFDRNFEMNSRKYCSHHKGLALLNGLRHPTAKDHECYACHWWSMLGLKGHPAPGGHLFNTFETLRMPGWDIALQTDGIHWRLRRYCAEHVESGPDELIYIGKDNRHYVYRNEQGQQRKVPPNSFLHVNKRGIVDAWLHAEYRDPTVGEGARDSDKWRPVATKNKYEYLMHTLGWKVQEWRHPFCKPPKRGTGSEWDISGETGW